MIFKKHFHLASFVVSLHKFLLIIEPYLLGYSRKKQLILLICQVIYAALVLNSVLICSKCSIAWLAFVAASKIVL